MFIIYSVEQTEGISFFFTRIKHYDFILVALVVLFITGKKTTGTHIWIH